MTLKSLDEANAEIALAREQLKQLSQIRGRNGIACPSCGNELFDMHDLYSDSFVTKRSVLCRTCGWRGWREVL